VIFDDCRYPLSEDGMIVNREDLDRVHGYLLVP
jgi:hypothetical protein